MAEKTKQVYNKFVTPEKWALVNQENKEIMDDYIQELKQKQMKPKTILQYTNDWKIVFTVILETFGNKSALELKKKDWRKMSLMFKELGMSNARVNRLLSACRSILSFCEDDDDYDYDTSTASKVKGLPKEEVREIVFLSNDQIMTLAKALEEREEWQKLALLFLAYDSMGRKEELAQVKKSGFENPKINATNEVVGKRGKKFRLVYFSKTKYYAKKWLDYRGVDDIDSMWILVDSEGNKKQADADNLYAWVKQMNDLLESIEGKEINFNVHSMRHSGLENLSQSVHSHYALEEIGKPNGLTLEELQICANHSNVATTMSYLKDKTEELKFTMFGFNPEDNLEDK